jgi:COMPASS component SWD3
MENHYNIRTKTSEYTITNKTLISDLSPVQCLKYDEDGCNMAAGCTNGKVVILTSSRMHTLNCSDSITSVCWKPKSSSSKTKNVLICSETEGVISQWHTTSRKLLHKLDTGCEVYALDYHHSLPLFVTGGKDCVIRLYDDSTKTLVTEFEPKHTSRIFCVKCHHDDPNVVYSGGWDCTVQIWDLRTNSSVRSILGPNVCGDSIDIQGNFVLAGSWREKNALQVFDYQSGEIVHNIDMEVNTWVYSAKFSNDGRWCVASGGNTNQLLLFDHYQQFGSVSQFPQPVFTVDITKNTEILAAGCGDGSISLFNIN